MVPGVLLERVDGRDVVAGHPAHAAAQRVRLAPLAALVVALDAHLLACAQQFQLIYYTLVYGRMILHLKHNNFNSIDKY